MLSLLIAFATPTIHCPPDMGQLRWRAVAQESGAYAVKVSVWDTNQDGKPSDGDLAHVDAASRGEHDLRLTKSWYRVGDTFASELTPAIAKAEAICEARPQVNAKPPALPALKALNRSLEAAYQPVIKRKKRIDYMRDKMLRWGKTICKDKQFRPHGEVAQLLVEKAAKIFDDLDGSTVRAAAHDLARHDDLACTKVAEQKISF